MSTIRQILANQFNARKSTGPRTPLGKARVVLNALKSGIDAKILVLRDENPEDFKALHQEYYDRWTPTTPDQRFLVDSMITSEWMIRRYQRIETKMWDHMMDGDINRQRRPELAFTLDMPGLDRINRHRNSANRAYHAALRTLQRLKKEELEELESANSAPIDTPSPQPAEIPPTSARIGFVPQTPARPVPTALDTGVSHRLSTAAPMIADN